MEIRQPRRLTGLVAALVIAVCAGLAIARNGADGALSALVAGAVTVTFLGSTRAVLGPVVAALPHASLATSMLFYFTKVAALAALFVVMQQFAEPHGPLVRAVVSGTIIAVAISWLGTRVFDESRVRIPAFDLPDDPDSAPDTVGQQ